MGTLSARSGAMTHEVKARVTSMYDVLTKARASVFSNSHLPVPAKLRYTTSLLFSRLMFDAGTWQALRTSDLRKLRHAYMSPLRSLTRMTNSKRNEGNSTSVRVLQEVEQPKIESKLRSMRLKCFKSLVHYRCFVHLRLVFALLPVKDSWINTIIDDIDIIRMHNTVFVSPDWSPGV